MSPATPATSALVAPRAFTSCNFEHVFSNVTAHALSCASLPRLPHPKLIEADWKAERARVGNNVAQEDIDRNLQRAAQIAQLVDSALGRLQRELAPNSLFATAFGCPTPRPGFFALSVHMWTSLAANCDLQLWYAPARPERSRQGPGGQVAFALALGPAGSARATLALTIPAALMQLARSSSPFAAVRASRSEVARAVLDGLAVLAARVSNICHLYIFDWVLLHDWHWRVASAGSRAVAVMGRGCGALDDAIRETGLRLERLLQDAGAGERPACADIIARALEDASCAREVFEREQLDVPQPEVLALADAEFGRLLQLMRMRAQVTQAMQALFPASQPVLNVQPEPAAA